jgi:hypothetical protein
VDDDKNVDESSTNDGGAIDDLKKDEPSKDSASVADQKDRLDFDYSEDVGLMLLGCLVGGWSVRTKDSD